MVKLRASLINIDSLSLGLMQLGFGLCNFRPRSKAAVESVLGQLERPSESRDVVVEKLSLRIKATRFEIVHRQFALKHELDVLQVRGRTLVSLSSCRD